MFVKGNTNVMQISFHVDIIYINPNKYNNKDILITRTTFCPVNSIRVLSIWWHISFCFCYLLNAKKD